MQDVPPATKYYPSKLKLIERISPYYLLRDILSVNLLFLSKFQILIYFISSLYPVEPKIFFDLHNDILLISFVCPNISGNFPNDTSFKLHS